MHECPHSHMDGSAPIQNSWNRALHMNFTISYVKAHAQSRGCPPCSHPCPATALRSKKPKVYSLCAAGVPAGQSVGVSPIHGPLSAYMELSSGRNGGEPCEPPLRPMWICFSTNLMSACVGFPRQMSFVKCIRSWGSLGSPCPPGARVSTQSAERRRPMVHGFRLVAEIRCDVSANGK